jgi:hypothetical protein
LHVDDVLADQHSRFHPMINFGEAVEVLGSAGPKFPQLP